MAVLHPELAASLVVEGGEEQIDEEEGEDYVKASKPKRYDPSKVVQCKTCLSRAFMRDKGPIGALVFWSRVVRNEGRRDCTTGLKFFSSWSQEVDQERNRPFVFPPDKWESLIQLCFSGHSLRGSTLTGSNGAVQSGLFVSFRSCGDR